MLGQKALGSFVPEIVTDVGEVGAFRLHRFHIGKRTFDGRVRRMRLVTQRVQEQNVEVLEQGQRAFRDFAVVCQVGGFTEPVTEAVSISVLQRYRCELEPVQTDSGAVQAMRLDLWDRGLRVAGLEDIAKRIANIADRLLRTVDRNGILAMEVERADIVEPHGAAILGVGNSGS